MNDKLCRNFLADLCSNYKLENNLITTAQSLDVPAELRSAQARQEPRDLVLARLANKIISVYGINVEAARWAVETWEIALASLPSARRHGNDPSLFTYEAGHHPPTPTAPLPQRRLQPTPSGAVGDDTGWDAVGLRLKSKPQTSPLPPLARPPAQSVQPGTTPGGTSIGVAYVAPPFRIDTLGIASPGVGTVPFPPPLTNHPAASWEAIFAPRSQTYRRLLFQTTNPASTPTLVPVLAGILSVALLYTAVAINGAWAIGPAVVRVRLVDGWGLLLFLAPILSFLGGARLLYALANFFSLSEIMRHRNAGTAARQRPPFGAYIYLLALSYVPLRLAGLASLFLVPTTYGVAIYAALSAYQTICTTKATGAAFGISSNWAYSTTLCALLLGGASAIVAVYVIQALMG